MQKKVIAVTAGIVLILAGVIGLGSALLHGHTIAVLQPAGPIAHKEMGLLILATLMMLVIVLPVFALTIAISLRYRAGNTKAIYMPEWDHHHGLEAIWWGFPCAVILALSVVTWISTHTLDPYKALASSKPAVTVQVIALDWKWLFIYPQQHIATVGYVEFPAGAPVNFELTSDAPMNSFWIPQLGGQIYAMPGMSTQLHLVADHPGSYYGESANISGRGFANMNFTARSVSQADFDSWVKTSQASPKTLSQATYDQLVKPSQNNPKVTYSAPAAGLYANVVMKYMSSGGGPNPNMLGMTMP